MTTHNQRVGYETERKARAKLYAEGAIDVQRAPASLGAFDHWALFPDHLKLIQIKETKYMVLFNDVIDEIKKKQVPPYCKKSLWIWYSYRPKRLNKNRPNYKGWKILEL
jgi:hypothetical protein